VVPVAPTFAPPPQAFHPQAVPPPFDRRRRALISAGLILVLALTAAAAGWWGTGDGGPKRPAAGVTDPNIGHELPFGSAVLALAGAPEVHYQSTVDGTGQVDVRVTNHDELIGTLSEDGQTYSLLGVGGKLFLKPPDSGLPGVDPTQAAAWKGKWLTGQPAQDLLGPVTSSFVTPAKLAGQLVAALNAAPDLQVVEAQLDGVAVLEAKTPVGLIAVTKAEPNRFVQIVPDSGADGNAPSAGSTGSTGAPGSPGSTSSPSATANAFGSPTSRTVEEAAVHFAPSSGATNVQVLPEKPGDVANTYQNLRTQTQQLATGSVNTDLQLSKQGDSITCNAGGCQVNVNVADAVSTSSGSVQGGTVTAVLTATVAVEGRPAGGCTSTSALPLSGTTPMSCSVPAAGGVFAAVDAEKKAQAQAESRAEGGRAVNYAVNFTDQYSVFATAQVNVDELVRAQGQEAADDAGQQDPCQTGEGNSFTAATPVLMADGTTKPIKDVVVGDRVAATDTGTWATGPHPVSALIRHTGPHSMVAITLSGGAKLQATDHHAFWDTTAGGFTDAVDVKPGDELREPDGALVAVNSTSDYQQDLTAYNLTIAGVHTYYVVAGGTPVLVHNEDPSAANSGAGTPCSSPYVWNPFRSGVDDTPQSPLPENAPFVKPGDKLKPGGYHYVVRPDGTVRAMNDDDMWKVEPGAGHTSLAGGKPVIMAGTFTVDSTGRISEFDNFSGHYQPTPQPGFMPLEEIARDAFAANGLPVPPPGTWNPWSPR